ncbi:MAG: glycosyltransferase [Geminicoccaceae bacterium]
MKNAGADVRLLSFVGHHDRDILPLFLAHYRTLGIRGFLFALHGNWPEAVLDWLTRQDDVAIWDLLGDRYEDSYRRSILNLMAERYLGDWVVLVDADEFLELPLASLAKTISALIVLGLDCLPAYLLQRMSRDGGLPVLDPGRSLDQQFPDYNFSLCEDMGVKSPTWKTKYPLSRVTENFAIDRGSHWPPNPTSLAHAPIRGVVHHLKWRAALFEAFEIERGETSNTYEMSSYRQWLDTHDGKLPTANARPCSREALVARGLLVKPDRHHLMIGSIHRKLRSRVELAETKKANLSRQLDRLFQVGRDKGAAAGLESTEMCFGEPGRICLITFDLSPPLTSGGIGTAMHALVETLRAVGHEVHLLFCPYEGPIELWQLWYDYWRNRGVTLHYFPRTVGEQQHYLMQSEFLSKITTFLVQRQFDVVHAADAAGYASFFAILRAAGLAFSRTKLVVTAHGGITWHRRGNQLDWTVDEAEASFAEKQMLRLADVICCPSQYMRERLLSEGQAKPEQLIVLPNALTSQTRSFGVTDRSVRPVDELVMMGRIEPRKGVDRFARAIKRLGASGMTDFKVTFLGKPGIGVDLEDVRAMLGPRGGDTRFITNYDHIEVVNYVKTHDCLVVIPSLRENLPYSLYECLENGVPVVASDAGGMAELVDEADRERILVAGDDDRLVDTLKDALGHGMRPGRLAFEPSVVGLELAALHGQLVQEARSPAAGQYKVVGDTNALPETGVIVYGGRDSAPNWADEANREAAKLDHDLLCVSHAAVHPHHEALPAMVRLLERIEADAVVVGYQIAEPNGGRSWGDDVRATVTAVGGPAEQAALRNLYGAGLFLIKRLWFNRLGGFKSDLQSSTVAHWDLLNRLAAAGGDVVGIPRVLATVDPQTAAALSGPIGAGFADRLLQPWLQQAPSTLQGFIRMAAASSSKTEASRTGKRQEGS